MIQRAWRVSVSKAKIRYYSRAYRHLTHLKRLERSVRIVQRAVGKRIILRRLLDLREFEEYPGLKSASWPPLRPAEEQEQQFWRHEKQALEDAVAERKQLERQEMVLQEDIEGLHKRLADAKARRTEEVERLRRHSTLEEHRRVKYEEHKQRRLQQLEGNMRRAIRLELERELDTARRLMLRTKRRGHFNVGGTDDERVELTKYEC
jgi:hypothetical protein